MSSLSPEATQVLLNLGYKLAVAAVEKYSARPVAGMSVAELEAAAAKIEAVEIADTDVAIREGQELGGAEGAPTEGA